MTEEEKSKLKRNIIWILKSLDVQGVESIEQVALILGKDVTVDEVYKYLEAAPSVFSENTKYAKQAKAVLNHFHRVDGAKKRVLASGRQDARNIIYL